MTINGFNNAKINAAQQSLPKSGTNLANNSGAGKDSPVLDIVAKRFNWGAFFLSWIWGLANRSYITLVIFPAAILSIIPFLGIFVQLGLCVWFGINGNKWAWQNKKWNSIEEFNAVQKKWAIADTIVEIIFVILIPIVIFTMTIPALMTDAKDLQKLQDSNYIKRASLEVHQAVAMNEALGNKCELTSEGLAKCFTERMSSSTLSGNSLTNNITNTVYTFTGNGSCLNEGNCSVLITTKYGTSATIPLYAKSDGYLEIKAEDLIKY